MAWKTALVYSMSVTEKNVFELILYLDRGIIAYLQK